MADKRYLVLSALASDRPGLVASVSDFIAARGGNVEDSRMVVLGAEFGILLLVSGTEDALAQITKEAPALQKSAGIDLLVKRTKSPEEHRRASVIPCLVSAESLDREGIVRAVSSALERLGLNIVSLTTTSYSAPFTGSNLFKLEARIDVPRGMTIAQVRTAMNEVARTEHLDVDVKSLVG
jgi:glycine cleavage system transcriptional repressor